MAVDDDLDQLQLPAKMHEKLGYDLLTANSGEAALLIIKDRQPTLVILDMVMPGGVDGLETYQQVLRIAPQQKTIIASGYTESAQVRAMRKLGVNIFV